MVLRREDGHVNVYLYQLSNRSSQVAADSTESVHKFLRVSHMAEVSAGRAMRRQDRIEGQAEVRADIALPPSDLRFLPPISPSPNKCKMWLERMHK